MEDTTLATTLILTSALLHALWNASVKRSSDKFAAILFVTSYGGLLYLPFIGLAPLPDPALWGWIAASAVSHLLYQLALSAALERGALTFVYPIARGTGPLLVAVFAFFYFEDQLPLKTIAAIAILVSGIFLTAQLNRGNQDASKPALAFALLTGTAIAGYTIIDGLAVSHAHNPLTFILWSGISAAPMIFLIGLKRRGWQVVRSSLAVWRQALPAAFFAHGGYALALTAFSLGNLAEIAALRETSIIFASIIGFLWLKEPFTHNKLAAVLLIATGALAIKVL